MDSYRAVRRYQRVRPCTTGHGADACTCTRGGGGVQYLGAGAPTSKAAGGAVGCSGDASLLHVPGPSQSPRDEAAPHTHAHASAACHRSRKRRVSGSLGTPTWQSAGNTSVMLMPPQHAGLERSRLGGTGTTRLFEIRMPAGDEVDQAGAGRPRSGVGSAGRDHLRMSSCCRSAARLWRESSSLGCRAAMRTHRHSAAALHPHPESVCSLVQDSLKRAEERPLTIHDGASLHQLHRHLIPQYRRVANSAEAPRVSHREVIIRARDHWDHQRRSFLASPWLCDPPRFHILCHAEWQTSDA